MARCLLNKAEAQLRLNKVSDAVATLNLTRQTHGGLPASEASTLADAWKDYKIERRVELFWEGGLGTSVCCVGVSMVRRLTMVKAPGSVINELTEPATFIEIKPDHSAFYIGNVQHVK